MDHPSGGELPLLLFATKMLKKNEQIKLTGEYSGTMFLLTQYHCSEAHSG